MFFILSLCAAGDNKYTLFCVVRGEPARCTFAVDIDKNKLVSHLKELIKEKTQPEFDAVAADELTLWKVNIPDDDDVKDTLEQLVLEDNEESGVQVLHPSWDIQDYFDGD